MEHFFGCKLSACELRNQQQNKFERETQIVKQQWKSYMAEDNILSRLWDFSPVYEARILSMITCRPDRIPGLERITSEMVDIMECLDFSFWGRVWFHDDPKDLTGPTLGRWLGVSHQVGLALCYFIIKTN